MTLPAWHTDSVDQLSTAVIANDIIKGLLAPLTAALGSHVTEKIRRAWSSPNKLGAYLQTVENRVGYFVSYRPERTRLDAAYVEPIVVDTVLSRSYIKPADYAALYESVRQITGRPAGPHVLPSALAAFRDGVFSLDIKRIPRDTLLELPAVLILGDAGTGKSALTAFTCLKRLRTDTPRIPIYLEAKDLTAPLRQRISEIFVQLDIPDVAPDEVDFKLAVYVDGLDELPTSRFKAVCRELGDLHKELPRAQIMAACRPAAYAGELSFLKEITILPFNAEQAEQFIRRWFSSALGPTADALLAKINRHTRLSEMSTQPLLLALMCSAFRRYLNVSRRQTTLFQQCLNSLLWEWDADRGVTRDSSFADLDLEKKVWLHSRVAVTLHEKNLRFADKTLVLSVLQDALPRFGISQDRAVAVLRELSAHHGILVQLTEETFGFAHLALQEFLAAKWYAADRRWEGLLNRATMSAPWWEPVIALSIAALPDATDALTALLACDDVPHVRRMQLAAECLRLDPILSPSVRENTLRTILHWFHNGTAEQSNAALYMLIGIEDDWSAQSIRRSLSGNLPTKETAPLWRSSATSFRPYLPPPSPDPS